MNNKQLGILKNLRNELIWCLYDEWDVGFKSTLRTGAEFRYKDDKSQTEIKFDVDYVIYELAQNRDNVNDLMWDSVEVDLWTEEYNLGDFEDVKLFIDEMKELLPTLMKFFTELYDHLQDFEEYWRDKELMDEICRRFNIKWEIK